MPSISRQPTGRWWPSSPSTRGSSAGLRPPGDMLWCDHTQPGAVYDWISRDLQLKHKIHIYNIPHSALQYFYTLHFYYSFHFYRNSDANSGIKSTFCEITRNIFFLTKTALKKTIYFLKKIKPRVFVPAEVSCERLTGAEWRVVRGDWGGSAVRTEDTGQRHNIEDDEWSYN